jgi:hypothetical protein
MRKRQWKNRPIKRQSQSHNSDDVKTQHSSQKLVVDITGQVDLPGNAPFRQKLAFYEPYNRSKETSLVLWHQPHTTGQCGLSGCLN